MIPITALSQVSFTLEHVALTAQHVEAALAGGGTSAAGAAFAAFDTLHTTCAATVGAVNAAQFGPFRVGGSCTYGCCSKVDWSWPGDYAPWVRQNLVPLVQGMDVL